MIKIQIKPLSVNEATLGAKVKSPKYRVYEKTLSYLLPKLKIPDGKIKIDYIFGFSSSGADADNCIKTSTDILSKKYGFNDNRIYELTVKKMLVKKGDEYLAFEITSLENKLKL